MKRFAVLLLVLLALGAGYRRDAWELWIDEDGDGENTRTEVLVRDADCRVVIRAHRVTQGCWDDPYTGERITDPRALDIDHIVPLEEAYNSGGSEWSAEKRRNYANWLPGLLAVSASANRQKGSRTPVDWLPKAMDRCAYVREWWRVKHTWGLTLTPAEVDLVLECAR